MDKLVKLLNEFEKEKAISEGGCVDEDDEYFGRSIEDGDIVNWSYDSDAHGFMKYYIISKEFKFIERLVEKDKIDRDNQALQYAKSDLSKFFTEWKDKNGMSDDYAMILMLLAIQDEPIEFLIQVLK